jgi:hypothetical protein
VFLLTSCPEPELTFDPGPAVLLVGQYASIEVTEGGDGSDLDQSTFVLKDAAGKTFDSKSADLELKKISNKEIGFAVPPGIAAGEASLTVGTKKGLEFSGKVDINRLMAMRDLSGKIWMLALLGDGTASQFGEAGPGIFGVGHGHLSVGYKGRLLASTSGPSRTLQLAWVASTLKVSSAHVFDSMVVVNDVLVTSTGATLVSTEAGTYYVKKPTTDPPGKLEVSSFPLATGKTFGLAVDRLGLRAVAITDPGATGTIGIARIDLSSWPPTLLPTVHTSWQGGADADLRIAVSHNGKNVVAVDGTFGRLALLAESAAPVEVSFPAGEEGAWAVAAAPDGSTFYVANKTSKNVSVVSVKGGTVSFETPITFDASANSKSGAPLDVAVSDAGEVVILLERDIVLIDKGAKAKTLTFTDLFKDKVNGEVGQWITIQP